MKQKLKRISPKKQTSFLHHSIPICCPLCKGDVHQEVEAYACKDCERTFPVISGIPDFRVFGDPYLGFEEDYKRTRLIAGNADRFDFEGLLKFYWKNSPETPDHLSKKFIRSVLIGELKGREILRTLEGLHREGRERAKIILELGCGTGGFLVPAAQSYSTVVGTDIALRWLVMARKRFEESGIEIPLVCCCAEYLPFRNEVFDLVVASATLEHTRCQDKVVLESHRVLHPEGMYFLSTPNRYSLSFEPHVYVWGVGYLPRSWMPKYVKFWKGVDYKNIHLLSYFELSHLLKKAFKEVRFYLPDIDDASLANFSGWVKFQVKLYRWLRARSLFRSILLLFGPMYHILCHKERS